MAQKLSCTRVCVCTRAHACVYVCVYSCVCVHVYVSVHVCVDISGGCVYSGTRVQVVGESLVCVCKGSVLKGLPGLGKNSVKNMAEERRLVEFN